MCVEGRPNPNPSPNPSPNPNPSPDPSPNPSQVRGGQNAVWAPADIDECIRAALRFGVGDAVECCVHPELGLWVGGKVVERFFRESN